MERLLHYIFGSFKITHRQKSPYPLSLVTPVHPVLDVLLPVQVRFVFAIEAQQQRVERKPSDPPASLNGPVLYVFGKLQYIQSSFSVVAQTQQAPQREREPVHHTASTPTRNQTHLSRVWSKDKSLL